MSNGIGGMNDVMMRAGQPRILAVSATTDSTGAATIDYDYDGTVSIATTSDSLGPTGVYTITFAEPWAVTLMEPAVVRGDATVTVTSVVASPSAGTIVVTLSAALDSSTLHVFAFVSDTHAN